MSYMNQPTKTTQSVPMLSINWVKHVLKRAKRHKDTVFCSIVLSSLSLICASCFWDLSPQVSKNEERHL